MIGALTTRVMASLGSKKLRRQYIAEAVQAPADAPAGKLQGGHADRRVRVAIVLPDLGVAGGSERAASLVANVWAERGWHVTIVTLDRVDIPAYHAIAPTVEIVRLGLPLAVPVGCAPHPTSLIACDGFAENSFVSPPDLVISFLTRTNVLSILAAIGTDIPVVVSERNNPEMQTFGLIWTALRRRLMHGLSAS